MIFVYKVWEKFCSQLDKEGLHSIPACAVTAGKPSYLVLKHDVETNVPRAYKMASIEYTYGHCGSYYVQAYLLDDPKNVELLKDMQKMGHEISYHYDVMDSSKGDMEKALAEFKKNKEIFEKNGFLLHTVCQHGNPVVERVGYTSNRDFFRSEIVRALYPDIADIMVNFKTAVPTEYMYFSDAGRKFKQIYDPINNDIVNSEDRNIPYEDLDEIRGALSSDVGNIISTHPHRWMASALAYRTRAAAFKGIRGTAKLLMKIPPAKKLMSKYFYLAKKI